jgi:ribosomal protein L37AE/L43A
MDKKIEPTWTVEHWTEEDWTKKGILTVQCSVCQTKIHTAIHVGPYLCSGCRSKVKLKDIVNG